MRTIRIMIVCTLLMGAATQIQAQDVFNYVLEKAEGIVNNPHSTEIDLKINQFKATALRYIPTAGIRLHGSANVETMDVQAVGLNEFLLKYFSVLQKVPAKDRKAYVMLFVEASRKHVLYPDEKNKEISEAFVKDAGGLTPFSLNTNWEKAVAEVNAALKK